MDRLSLLKVLADSSRFAIYEELAGSGQSLTTLDIAQRLDLHPNTVRLHLEKMREAGLLEVAPDRHGTVGRPQHLWSVASPAPPVGIDGGGSRLLAQLLAEAVAHLPGGAGEVLQAGRRKGLEGSRGARPRRGGSRTGERLRLYVAGFVEQLEALGFGPSLEAGDLSGEGDRVEATVSFSRCPFRDVAALYPDLVCELHRAIAEGILEGLTGSASGVEAHLEGFSTLVDPDPCRAAVSVSA